MLVDLLVQLGAGAHLVRPQCATRRDVRRMHSEAYVAAVETASRGDKLAYAAGYGLGTTDVPVFSGMHQATLWVVGGTLTAARLVASGKVCRALHLAGGLHHAHREAASGFCVYNDPAIAIAKLQESGFERIAYLDIDAHHGDGVQDLFYEDPGVLTISLHESGRYLFPGTGFPKDIGRGPGRGYAANFPLEPGTAHDSYLAIFDRFVRPIVAAFDPDVLVVECGADAHAADPLAHLNLNTHTFEALYYRIFELADTHCGGQAVMNLGGGYDLDTAPRVWALLALMLLRLNLPANLPETWLETWQSRLNRTLTRTLHDGPQVSYPDLEVRSMNCHTATETLNQLQQEAG